MVKSGAEETGTSVDRIQKMRPLGVSAILLLGLLLARRLGGEQAWAIGIPLILMLGYHLRLFVLFSKQRAQISLMDIVVVFLAQMIWRYGV